MTDPYRISEDEPDWLFTWGNADTIRVPNKPEEKLPPANAIEYDGYVLTPEECDRLKEIKKFKQRMGGNATFVSNPKERERYIRKKEEQEKKINTVAKMLNRYPNITDTALAKLLAEDPRRIARWRVMLNLQKPGDFEYHHFKKE